MCLGNICRSPAAEGVFSHQLLAAGLGARVRADSAGTLSFHVGSSADARMRQAAQRRGYRLTSLARQVVVEDFFRFSHILAMDSRNLRDLRQIQPSESFARLGLFSEIALGEDWEVPDPYYGGADGFEEVLDLIERGCQALVDQFKKESW